VERLWNELARETGRGTFDPSLISHLPEPVRRYFLHAIAPGTPLASSAVFELHGTFKLGTRWVPYEAKQVLAPRRGFVWRAWMRWGIAPLSGYDLCDGETGEMNWKLLGFVRLVRAGGPDIARSARGRLDLEAVLVPSTLLGAEWTVESGTRLTVRFGAHTALIEIGEDGRLFRASLARWGDPDKKGWREEVFGVEVEEEARFGGYTIPRTIRGGWQGHGDFIRQTVARAEFK
jgi:hypothetical protein